MNELLLQEPTTRRSAAQDGLTQAEVQARLAEYGYNELPEKKANPLLKFLSAFWGPIPWMIEAAVVLSALVGHWADFGIILSLLVANAVIGFWEEFQAGNFDLDRSTIQTLMYLKLSVAGHLTIFVTRTRGPFWSIPPSPVLFGAVVFTQIVATLLSVYGPLNLMTPLGWKWALLVWGYALAWFLIEDRVKLLAYHVFDPEQPPLMNLNGSWPSNRAAHQRRRYSPSAG